MAALWAFLAGANLCTPEISQSSVALEFSNWPMDLLLGRHIRSDRNSKPVARAQGIYALDGISESGLLMAMDFALTISTLRIRGTRVLQLIRPGSEKVTCFRFYFHDNVSGDNPTSVTVAKATNTMKSASAFGLVNVIDNALTLGADPNSEPVGRAQGLYAFDGMSEFTLLMAIDLAFTNGRYNGSSLSILGRNQFTHPVREMPIVGGTGVFQLARGFVTLKTYKFNTTSNNAIVQYDVTAIHY
ncbi:Dirigent protein [Dillenia turbinata]|uniref:Dirigent protein n=1 Tax=Dillenia turbinata TaxID=194707 RepID=A0AAN8ZQI8_9MAGN